MINKIAKKDLAILLGMLAGGWLLVATIGYAVYSLIGGIFNGL
jgi:hypothetical protein